LNNNNILNNQNQNRLNYNGISNNPNENPLNNNISNNQDQNRLNYNNISNNPNENPLNNDNILNNQDQNGLNYNGISNNQGENQIPFGIIPPENDFLGSFDGSESVLDDDGRSEILDFEPGFPENNQENSTVDFENQYDLSYFFPNTDDFGNPTPDVEDRGLYEPQNDYPDQNGAQNQSNNRILYNSPPNGYPDNQNNPNNNQNSNYNNQNNPNNNTNDNYNNQNNYNNNSQNDNRSDGKNTYNSNADALNRNNRNNQNNNNNQNGNYNGQNNNRLYGKNTYNSNADGLNPNSRTSGDKDYRNLLFFANNLKNVCLILRDQSALLTYIHNLTPDNKLRARIASLLAIKENSLKEADHIFGKVSPEKPNMKRPTVSRETYIRAYNMLASLQNTLDQNLEFLINNRLNESYINGLSALIAAENRCKAILKGIKR
jgi:hypothetical protein